MRGYELRFVTDGGRVLRGPIVTQDGIEDMRSKLRGLDDFAVFRMKFGHHFFILPKGTLQNGYLEIKPVGRFYQLIRAWMVR